MHKGYFLVLTYCMFCVGIGYITWLYHGVFIAMELIGIKAEPVSLKVLKGARKFDYFEPIWSLLVLIIDLWYHIIYCPNNSLLLFNSTLV